MEDWKDKLGAAFGMEVPSTPPAPASDDSEKPADAVAQQGTQVVHVVLDRKGRHGKQATIVTDLQCDDNALALLARELKQLCGVGGSARGGEILIQGDFRTQVLAQLKEMGFKARVI